jgi:hypothetical protein
MEEGLSRKYARLNSLLGAGNAHAPHISVEIDDIVRDLKASGQSELDIIARTHSRRYTPGFDPRNPSAVPVETPKADPSSE